MSGTTTTTTTSSAAKPPSGVRSRSRSDATPTATVHPDKKESTDVEDDAGADQAREDGSGHPPSRYRNPLAKRPMFVSLSDDQLAHIVAQAIETRLQANRSYWHECELTPELVDAFPVQLERFRCWGVKPSSGSGISCKSSGGKHNSAQYIQVGISQEMRPAGCGWKPESAKLIAHKAVLCQRLGVRYDQLEGQGLETSHLCHSIRGCWRPGHLCAEEHAVNTARNSKHGCAGWFFWRDTLELVCFCRHEPSCMFVRVFETKGGVKATPVKSSTAEQ